MLADWLDEALELGQQVADFVQATLGGADDVAGAAGVVDRRSVMPACSALRFSLAIRPAGSSAPVLIFRPVLSRWRLVLSVCVVLSPARAERSAS